MVAKQLSHTFTRTGPMPKLAVLKEIGHLAGNMGEVSRQHLGPEMGLQAYTYHMSYVLKLSDSMS